MKSAAIRRVDKDVDLSIERVVGFTGTRTGMTRHQHDTVTTLLERLSQTNAVTHGDCLGADAEFDAIAAKLGIIRIARPGRDKHGESPYRAYCDAEIVAPTLTYQGRNRVIVATSYLLIACPKGEMELRSGTWSTIRYAESRNSPVALIRP